MNHDSFKGDYAVAPGLGHIRRKKNGHDRAYYGEFTHNGTVYRYGYSIDGLGAGTHSDSGSGEADLWMQREIPYQIRRGCSLEYLPVMIWNGLVQFIVESLPRWDVDELIEYILNSKLFTVFCFVQEPEETVLFYIGDGIAELNGELIINAHHDAPDCVAYAVIQMLDPQYFKRKADERGLNPYTPHTGFHVVFIDTDQINTLLVGSDSWLDELALTKEVWSVFEPDSDVSLQELINGLTGMPYRMPKHQLHFEDDVSVAALYRVRVEPPATE